MLPAPPPKALSSFLPHSRGNYPLMRENYKRSVWPHAQGPRASREGVSVLEGNWKQMHGGVFFGGSTVPSHPRSYRFPNLDFHGNRFHAWASRELS